MRNFLHLLLLCLVRESITSSVNQRNHDNNLISNNMDERQAVSRGTPTDPTSTTTGPTTASTGPTTGSSAATTPTSATTADTSGTTTPTSATTPETSATTTDSGSTKPGTCPKRFVIFGCKKCASDISCPGTQKCCPSGGAKYCLAVRAG